MNTILNAASGSLTPPLLGAHAPGSRAGSVAVADGLQLPRVLFYLGSATLGILTLRPVGGLTLSDLLFMAAFGLTVATSMLSRSSNGKIDQKMVIGGLFYAIGALLSAFGNEDSLRSLDVVVRLLFLVVAWFWLATVLLKTPEQVRLAAMLWVLSVGASGVAALVQLLAGDVVPGSDIVWGRMTGFTGHPNDLGGSSAVALVVGITLLVGAPTRFRIQPALLLATLACLAGIFLSGSVSAFLGAAAAVAAVTFFYLPSVRKVLVIGVLALVGGLMFILQGQLESATPTLRFKATTSETGTLDVRADNITSAFDRILTNPLLGEGPLPGGRILSEHEARVHNAFIATWYETGMFGLAGFTILVGSALRLGILTTKSLDAAERPLALGLTWAFIAYLIFGLAQPTLYVRYGWVPVALLMALWTRSQKTRADREPSPNFKPDEAAPITNYAPSQSRVIHGGSL